MADYKEVTPRAPVRPRAGTDKLRKTAANRLKHLLANGWRETERQQSPDHVMVRFERTGHAPMKARLPKQGPEIRIERRPRRDDRAAAGRPRPRPALDRVAPNILRFRPLVQPDVLRV